MWRKSKDNILYEYYITTQLSGKSRYFGSEQSLLKFQICHLQNVTDSTSQSLRFYHM